MAECGRRTWLDEEQEDDNPCVRGLDGGHDGLHQRYEGGGREWGEGAHVNPAWIVEQRLAGWPDMHPEGFCHKCGNRNAVWNVDSREAWLAATGAWAAETGREGICCLNCFTQMHEVRTEKKTPWVLVPLADWLRSDRG